MDDIENSLQLDFGKPEDVKRYYATHVQDTFYSKWHFLRWSSASSFLCAARGFSELIQIWEKNVERNGHDRAEVGDFLTFQYKVRVAGPISSAVLMPAFAIESFLRFYAEVVLAEQTTTGTAWRLALSGFDNKNFPERLKSLLGVIGVKPIPKQLNDSVKNLVSFRNDFVHDIPLWNIEGGYQFHFRKGKDKLIKVDKAFGGDYPLLDRHVMPMKLSHARRALTTHDELVTYIINQSPKDFISLLEKRAGRPFSQDIHIRALLGVFWDQAAATEKFWTDEVLSWFDVIPIKEQIKYVRNRMRKSRIKRVK